MGNQTNLRLIELAQQIAVARVQNSTIPVNAESGNSIADFIEVIYKKLVELSDQTN